jgi:pyruvate,water dikinase
MLATKRNRAIALLAGKLRDNPTLKDMLLAIVRRKDPIAQTDWIHTLSPLQKVPGGNEFFEGIERLMQDFMDFTVGSQRITDQPELILPHLLELSEAANLKGGENVDAGAPEPEELELRLMEAVGDNRRDEAVEMLRIGRLSWRLRDDDNLLVSRIESQLYRAAEVGMERLQAVGRIKSKTELSEEAAAMIIDALKDHSQSSVVLPKNSASPLSPIHSSSISPRQLIGQPAAPGLATGAVRRVQGPDSFATFRAGEILVCDAIQPMMTHLVPLAGAIVERRGGMLIHGAIIARELGIPCVNGIVDLMELLSDGEVVTVDGHLGIVTIGEPEFDLELEMIASK